MSTTVRAALDEYTSWKRDKDREWRADWEAASANRARLADLMKAHLSDCALVDVSQEVIDRLQRTLVAARVPIDDINEAFSLLKYATKHVGASTSWFVHLLQEPDPEAERAAAAQLQAIHDEQLRRRRELLESFTSPPKARKRAGWTNLEEARALCADLLKQGRVGNGSAIAAATRVETRFVAFPGPAAVGASRLGGHPDVPRGFAWPTANGVPLAFLLQLNLADLPSELASELPARGHLWFFYDAEKRPWGFDPKDASGWKVMYDASETLAPMPPPAPVDADFRARSSRIALYQVPALVPWWSPEVRALPKPVFDRFNALDDELDLFDTRHQVLGIPAPYQTVEMALECQLASNGIACGDEVPASPRVTELSAGAADWRLLLQLQSDEAIGLNMGGRLYFWIRRQDLRDRNFDRVWLICQK